MFTLNGRDRPTIVEDGRAVTFLFGFYFRSGFHTAPVHHNDRCRHQNCAYCLTEIAEAEQIAPALHTVFTAAHKGQRDKVQDPNQLVPGTVSRAFGALGVINQHAENRNSRHELCKGHKARELVKELQKQRKMQERGIVPRGVEHQGDSPVQHQKQAEDIAAPAAGRLHTAVVQTDVQIDQHCHHNQHQNEFHKEGGKAPVLLARGVHKKRAEGQTLEQLLFDAQLTVASTVKKRTQANHRNGKRQARRYGVQKSAFGTRAAQGFRNDGRQIYPEKGSRQAVTANGVIRHGAQEGGVLLLMAVPVQHPTEQQGKNNGERQKTPESNPAVGIRGVKRIGKQEPGDDSERNDDTAPVNRDAAAVYRYGFYVHPLTSRLGTAVAK